MAGWADAARQVEIVNIAESGDAAKPITRQDALLTVSHSILTTTKLMLETIKPVGAGGRLDRNPQLDTKVPSVEHGIEIVLVPVQDIGPKGIGL